MGQIHGPDDEHCKLYYRKLPGNERGSVYFAFEPLGADDEIIPLLGSPDTNAEDPEDGIGLGEVWSYFIDVQGRTLTVGVTKADGTSVMHSYDMGDDYDDAFLYFKAGVYNQNDGGDQVVAGRRDELHGPRLGEPSKEQRIGPAGSEGARVELGRLMRQPRAMAEQLHPAVLVLALPCDAGRRSAPSRRTCTRHEPACGHRRGRSGVIVPPLLGTIRRMTRLSFLLVLFATLGCGDDSGDGGAPNGKPCVEDADCASDFCLPDDQNGPICAKPGGENEGSPTKTETGGAEARGSSSSTG